MTDLLLREQGVLWRYTDKNGVEWTAAPMIYHIALYRNRDDEGYYEERYCMANLAIAKKAVAEQEEVGGDIKYWQKWHNKNITVVGCHAYESGSLMLPKNALYSVSWDADELSTSAEKDW